MDGRVFALSNNGSKYFDEIIDYGSFGVRLG